MANKMHKPEGLKYTDMCIWMDEHLEQIKTPNEYPEVETKMYEYLYHTLYALACKQNFFKNFEDYEPFALESAGELYITMRNKEINAGKEIRGKIVEPINSTLNFIKKVLFPLKVNYEKRTFQNILNPDINQDTSILEKDIKDSIKRDYKLDLEEELKDVLKLLPSMINKIINQTPYRNDEAMCEKLKMSIILTFLYDITLPNKLKNKLNKYINKVDEDKILYLYKYNCSEVVLWHINPSLKDYIRLLVTKLKRELTHEIYQTRHYNDLSDDVVNDIMNSAYSLYDSEGDF